MLLHKHFACVKCIVTSLHNYIVLVTGTTIIKQVIKVHFNVCHRAQGQSLKVHFEPDDALIVTIHMTFEDQCI